MSSRLSMSNIGRTNIALFEVQQQLATGRAILRPSDDIVKAAAIGVIDDRLDRSAQYQRNFSHADSALNEIDSALAEGNTIALQAKSIAAEQLNATSSATERAAQASIVDGLLRGLLNTANRQGVAGHVFGGSQSSMAPVSFFLGGYRFSPTGPGATSDLGLASSAPITVGDGNPIARSSTRVRGTTDLNPSITADTRLADVVGARGLGITPGSVQFSFDGGPLTTINMSGSDTVEDVRVRVEAGLRRYEADNSVTVLGPGGVSMQGGSLTIDVVGGTTPPTLEFFDIGTGVTSKDLGLTRSPATPFTQASPAGADIGARATWRTPVSALAGVTGALGSIQISNAGHTATVDLSSARTLQDVRNLIQGTNLGVRVEINAACSGIDIVNEVSTTSANSLSIGEVGGGDTATRLGVRTLSEQTLLSAFNFGQGVQIIDGVNDPTNGLASTSLNEDFVITLGDSANTQIAIDLRPQDVVSVQTLLDRVNAQAGVQLAAAGLPANAFVAGLSPDGNGLRLTQDSTFPTPVRIEARNNSTAAQQLGLLGGTYVPGSASLIGEDRAKVRVDSVFTHLLDLRQALASNDISGIGLAGSGMDAAIGEIAELRGVVGGHAQRVESAANRESDRATLDESIRSGLRDADYTQAATRYSLLQTQLEAGLRVTALASQRSLLDFLG